MGSHLFPEWTSGALTQCFQWQVLDSFLSTKNVGEQKSGNYPTGHSSTKPFSRSSSTCLCISTWSCSGIDQHFVLTCDLANSSLSSKSNWVRTNWYPWPVAASALLLWVGVLKGQMEQIVYRHIFWLKPQGMLAQFLEYVATHASNAIGGQIEMQLSAWGARELKRKR